MTNPENAEETPAPKLTLKELKESSYKDDFDKIVSDLEDCLKNDFTIIQACLYAGINPDTYYEWVNKSDEFKARMAKAEQFLVMVSKKNVTTAITGKKMPLTQEQKETLEEMHLPEPYEVIPSLNDSWKFLRVREKSRFSQRTELTGADGESLANDVGDLREINENTKKLLKLHGKSTGSDIPTRIEGNSQEPS